MSFFVLLGSLFILLLFTSLSTQTITISVSNPSLTTYSDLQVLHSDTLKCPCSTVAIPYQKLVSFSPILHQVCSSDFVDDRWLSILEESGNRYMSTDWRNLMASQFPLLSDLCQLANNTMHDAINRFLRQSFVASSVLTEIDLNTQLNATFNQIFQSTTVYFGFLVDIVQLLMQVDQPFMGSTQPSGGSFTTNLISNITANRGVINLPVQVCPAAVKMSVLEFFYKG